jgi:hypothetical protein
VCSMWLRLGYVGFFGSIWCKASLCIEERLKVFDFRAKIEMADSQFAF